ncbi:unnamed protein product [Microthlaspi erraticum]|uniref:Jacalin-type lectin domain-containing protein n=1 Tax=Microthlaspi erraticum TaxID=1685480 RepID=A0A6D2JHE8_9BRAS|nr:unnamed protein product [Microthlaspi erraticum]
MWKMITFRSENMGLLLMAKEVDFEVEYREEYITSITISWSIISTDPYVTEIEFLTSYSRSQVLGIVNNNYMLKPKNGLGPKLVGILG